MRRLRVYLHDLQTGVGKIVFGRRNPPLASCVFHILLLLLLGLIAYTVALVLVARRLRWRHLHVYTVSLTYLLLVVPHFKVVDFLPLGRQSLLVYWLLMVPLAPMGGLAMFSWNKVAWIFGKRTLEVEQEERVQRQKRIAERRAQHAKRKALLQPHASSHYLNIGVKIEGEEFPDHIGIETHGDWVKLPTSLFFQHAFVLGTTGAGKTELLLRLIYETLHNTRLRVYVIDGKGDLAFAEKVATLAYQHGRGSTPIFMMGQTVQAQANSALYDGFRGDREAIANRLAMMMAVDKTVGNAQHYSETYKALVHLICGVGHPSLGITPPRDFDEVLARLTFRWLSQTYAKVPRELEAIYLARGGKENLIAAASARLANLARSLAGAVGRAGFCLEDSHCAIFSLRTQSVSVDAKKFIDFLIEDVKDWIGKRQPLGVEALLIIDEFGAFNNESITDVLTLARSSKVGVILAAQEVAQLGNNSIKRQILANCNTYFLMKANFPEELVELAGTLFEVEPSYQLEDGIPTGRQSARIQHQYKVPPNDVAQLKQGQCYIINSRYALKAHAAMLAPITLDPAAIATHFVRHEQAGAVAKVSPPRHQHKEDNVPDIPD